MVHTLRWDGGHAGSGNRVLWQSSTLDFGHSAQSWCTRPADSAMLHAGLSSSDEHLRFCAAVWSDALWPAAGPFWPAPGNAWDKRRWTKSKTVSSEDFLAPLTFWGDSDATHTVRCNKRTYWGANVTSPHWKSLYPVISEIKVSSSSLADWMSWQMRSRGNMIRFQQWDAANELRANKTWL